MTFEDFGPLSAADLAAIKPEWAEWQATGADAFKLSVLAWGVLGKTRAELDALDETVAADLAVQVDAAARYLDSFTSMLRQAEARLLASRRALV